MEKLYENYGKQAKEIYQMEIKEKEYRENNLNKINQTIFEALATNQKQDKEITHLKLLKNSLQQQNQSLLKDNKHSQQQISQLQQENTKFRSIISSLQSAVKQAKYKEQLFVKISQQNRSFKARIQEQQGKIQMYKDQPSENCIKNIKSSYQKQILRIRQQYQKNLQQFTCLCERQKRYLQKRVQQCQQTIQKYHTILTQQQSQSIINKQIAQQKLKKQISSQKNYNNQLIMLRQQNQQLNQKLKYKSNQKLISFISQNLKNRNNQLEQLSRREYESSYRTHTEFIKPSEFLLSSAKPFGLTSYDSTQPYKMLNDRSKFVFDKTNNNSYSSTNLTNNIGGMSRTELGMYPRQLLQTGKKVSQNKQSPLPSARYQYNSNDILKSIEMNNRPSLSSFPNKNIATQLLCQICNNTFAPNQFSMHQKFCKKQTVQQSFYSHRDRQSLFNRKSSVVQLGATELSPRKTLMQHRTMRANSRSHNFQKKQSNFNQLKKQRLNVNLTQLVINKENN